MVMGGDSCSEGRGFESQLCILDGHFSHIFLVKIVLKDEKNIKYLKFAQQHKEFAKVCSKLYQLL